MTLAPWQRCRDGARGGHPGYGCFTMFDDTARGLAVAWVLFQGLSKKDAARRLGCNLATVSGWIKAYPDSGKWWPDPVIRNRHADNVL